MWYKLNELNIEKYILYENIKNKTCIENLQNFIKLFHFIDFHEFDNNCPITYALSNDNLRLQYTNPYKTPPLKMYELNNPFSYPLIDHALYFRNEKRQIVLVSNPYLSNDEIASFLEKGEWKRTLEQGDYSSIKYMILGKNKSYYNPNQSNLIVFYMGEIIKN